jgi:hypothetical protein
LDDVAFAAPSSTIFVVVVVVATFFSSLVVVVVVGGGGGVADADAIAYSGATEVPANVVAYASYAIASAAALAADIVRVMYVNCNRTVRAALTDTHA